MFYGYGEPIYVLLMILSILVNYYMALIMDKSHNKKKWLIIDLIFNLGLLFIFKYTNIFRSLPIYCHLCYLRYHCHIQRC